jgi:hypothetical protein
MVWSHLVVRLLTWPHCHDLGGGHGHKNFQLSRLRAGTPFEHLLLVVRSRNPTDWTDLVQLDDPFWLGHVRCTVFDRRWRIALVEVPPRGEGQRDHSQQTTQLAGAAHPVGPVQKTHTELVEQECAWCAARVAAQTYQIDSRGSRRAEIVLHDWSKGLCTVRCRVIMLVSYDGLVAPGGTPSDLASLS